MFPWNTSGYALAPHGNVPVERGSPLRRLVPVSAALHVNKTLETEIALHRNCIQTRNFYAEQFRSTGALYFNGVLCLTLKYKMQLFTISRLER